jgi:class 3 adenylate cyclase
MNCGQPQNVSTVADDARLTRLAAAAPAPLAKKMRAAHLAGERKIVTVLFADVVGSTSLAEKMDAEDWTALMNRAFDRFSPSIYKFEGTIARLMGDALLAFFGAPVTHEDDPLRAVRAGLDMLSVAREFAQGVQTQFHFDFQIRVGINTGLVVVGEVGSDLKYEYTAMGDAVNLAARMQTAARPGTVLISENTSRYILPAVDATDLGPIEVKGKAEPVRVYEVHSLKAEPGRMRGVAGLESPMVGRDAELNVLTQLSAAICEGKGHAVVIVGEPGLGKTRLIAEWKSTEISNVNDAKPNESAVNSQNANVRFSEGHCLSYGQGLAYHLLIDVLRSVVGVTPAASETEARAALEVLCARLFGADALEVFPYLAHLLSLRLEGAALERVQALDPQALQSLYLSSARRLLLALAAQQPQALILDDIHWADPSSTDLLIKLLTLTTEAPILLCFVTRPDRDAPGWRLVTSARESLGAAGFTELSLNPLSDSDSRLLVYNLLEIEALPDHIRSIILQKAEGNPFFVEEVIRMLMDRGALVKKDGAWAAGRELETVEIPDNLQGLLLARIDRMPEDVKRTLRVASVIGRQFSVRVLEQVLGQE